MNMYDRDGQKIGTKTITQGGGLQRPDGSFGNGVTMNFAQRAQPPVQAQQQQPQQQNNFSSYGQRAQAPTLKYEEPTEGQTREQRISMILRNIAAKKNFEAKQSYDKLNTNAYSQQQDRLNRKLISNNELDFRRDKMQNDNVNFQIEQDGRNFQYNQRLKQQQALKNVMTPYQQQQIKQREQETRQKAIADGTFNSLLPADVKDEISNDNLLKARQYYMETGKIPSFNKSGSWYDDDYEIAQSPVAGSNQPKAPQGNQPKEETPEERAYKRAVAEMHNKIMQY